MRKACDNGRRYGVGGKGMKHRKTIWCRWERHGSPAGDMVSVGKAKDTGGRNGVGGKGMRLRQTILCRWGRNETPADNMISVRILWYCG
ncbi:hypothetical protein DPMN_101420 [Dreissena polymorpha]|uniref:Uncharacterized protein n=1 Tax=Dreissena polymorpha TaxID=45954 RepID=A0A9D4LJB7_DREPO|nr:hypothetical protein DPMN_101420 [Dreissena polymorpha]